MKNKNIVIAYQHNLITDYFKSESLVDPYALFADGKEMIGAGAMNQAQELRTTDGIQYWVFGRGDDVVNEWELESESSLAYWLTELQQKLRQSGEKIDVLVVPASGISFKEGPTLTNFVAEAKRCFPEMDIVILDPKLNEVSGEKEKERRLAWALDAESTVGHPPNKAVLSRTGDGVAASNNQSYALSDGVDYVVKNLEIEKVPDFLRTQVLGIEKITESAIQPAGRQL